MSMIHRDIEITDKINQLKNEEEKNLCSMKPFFGDTNVNRKKGRKLSLGRKITDGDIMLL